MGNKTIEFSHTIVLLQGALSKLADQKYLAVKASAKDPRDITWRLSKKGYALHDEALKLALERERRLIADVDPENFEAF